MSLPCSHVLDNISAISPPFLSSFARFHRLAEAVPTSRKPEPRAEKQCEGGPNTVSSAGLTPGVRNAWQARDEDDIDEAEIMQKAQKKSFLKRKFKSLSKKKGFFLYSWPSLAAHPTE